MFLCLLLGLDGYWDKYIGAAVIAAGVVGSGGDGAFDEGAVLVADHSGDFEFELESAALTEWFYERCSVKWRVARNPNGCVVCAGDVEWATQVGASPRFGDDAVGEVDADLGVVAGAFDRHLGAIGEVAVRARCEGLALRAVCSGPGCCVGW